MVSANGIPETKGLFFEKAFQRVFIRGFSRIVINSWEN